MVVPWGPESIWVWGAVESSVYARAVEQPEVPLVASVAVARRFVV